MSKRIAVWLPDELVAFVDEFVDSGAERSRVAVVSRALKRERRRTIVARDAEILSRTGPDPELRGLAEHLAESQSLRQCPGLGTSVTVISDGAEVE
jgi:Arc/MetJ-type ribon-helix-helix transcriptional regulator